MALLGSRGSVHASRLAASADGLWTTGFGFSAITEILIRVRPDPVLPPVFSLQQAVKAGLTATQAERRVAIGRWRRLRRGAFCLEERWQAAAPEQRHVLLAFAVYLANVNSRTPYAFSHASAAALHGLPVSRALLASVVVTVDPTSRRRPRRDRDLIRQVAALPPDVVVRRQGLPVTSPARTVADCLRHLDALDAVPIADAAVRRTLCTVEEIAAVLARQETWPYAAAGLAGLRLVDGRRESWLESGSAVVMHRHDIPAPVPQVTILDAHGRFVARSDFAWLDHGVVGEADGRSKYLNADAVDAFEAEKDRQARLEALGLIVVRWNARHVRGDPPVLVARLQAALGRGNRSRFTGRAA